MIKAIKKFIFKKKQEFWYRKFKAFFNSGMWFPRTETELRRASKIYCICKDIDYAMWKGCNLWGIDSLTEKEKKEIAKL